MSDAVDCSELERLDRDALIERAMSVGVSRARVLTRVELVDELILRGPDEPQDKQRARGFFGVARDLLANVIERGLHLPDAAERIRAYGSLAPSARVRAPSALPTVTLAEIYAAQGHVARAIDTIQSVLIREPDHEAARAFLSRLTNSSYPRARSPSRRNEEDELPGPGQLEEARTTNDNAVEDACAPAPPRQHVTPFPRGGARGGTRSAPLVDGAARGGTRSAPLVDGAARGGTRTAPLVDGAARGGTRSDPLVDHTLEGPASDVDECVAIPGDPCSLFVYWALRFRTMEHVVCRCPGAEPVLRLFVVTPSVDGPKTALRDCPIASFVGDMVIRDLQSDVIVRVAVGWRSSSGDFHPAAHSAALETVSSDCSTWGIEAIFRSTPTGLKRVDVDDPDAPAIFRALGRARRTVDAGRIMSPDASPPVVATAERWIYAPAAWSVPTP